MFFCTCDRSFMSSCLQTHCIRMKNENSMNRNRKNLYSSGSILAQSNEFIFLLVKPSSYAIVEKGYLYINRKVIFKRCSL